MSTDTKPKGPASYFPPSRTTGSPWRTGWGCWRDRRA